MPEAIKDDCLRDTVVTLFFHSDFSQEYLERLVKDGLDRAFDSPNEFNRIPVVIKGVVQNNKFFLANSQFRIQVLENQISFNIVNQYPRWAAYSSFINSVLHFLGNHVSYQSVDARYVSFFGPRELSEMIDGTLKLNQLDAFAGSQYRFSCAVNEAQNVRVATAEVQLSDRYHLSPTEVSSIIDIRVKRAFNSNESSLDDAINGLEIVHRHQKHLFFLILSESFYNELKV